MIGRKRFLLYLYSKKQLKKKIPRSTKPEVKEIPIPAVESAKQQKESDGQSIKKIHLTVAQVEEKIAGLKERLPGLGGAENRHKRQRVYHELSLLQKAVNNPEIYLVDPTAEEKKRISDHERRINKKIQKKEVIVKEIAREKKSHQHKVCLVCKKEGHIAANCRENTAAMRSLLCYKCGASDHTLKECPDTSRTLKFATCFVCKEVGHISRECPTNSKGIYPKGGSCYICGGIDHLKQDCPKNPMNKIRNKKKNEEVEQFFEGDD